MQDRTRAEIAACFNAFPQSRATDQDVFIATVIRDVQGLDDEAVIRACQAFTAGDVKGQSLDFAPAVPRFVRVCREMQAAMDYARRPQIQHQPEPEHSDEHRAMMLKRLAEWGKSLGGKSDAA